jgi:hypothetical protein
VLSALIRFLISSWNWHTRLRLKGLRPKRRRRAIRLIADQKTRLFLKRPTTDGVNRKEDSSYEIKQCFTYRSGLNRFSGRLAQIALSRAVTSRWGMPADCEQPQAIAWRKRRLTKLGRETRLGPITGHKACRSRYRRSQPEPLVRRFNITPVTP